MPVNTVQYNVWTELEQKLNKTLENQFPELTFHNGVDIPTTFDLEPGAQTVSVEQITSYGEAALLGARSADIPLIKIQMTKGTAPIFMAAAAYAIDFQSARSYSFSGKSGIITDKSVRTVRRALDEKMHYFAAYGDKNVDARGLLNALAITPTPQTFDVNAATFMQALEWLMSLVLGMGLDTRDVLGATDILMGRRTLNALAKLRESNSSPKSVLEAFRDNLRALGEGYENVTIRRRVECESAMLEDPRWGVMTPGTNKDRVVVYHKHPDVCARQMEGEIAQMFPEEYVFTEGAARVFPMFSVASETQIYTTNAIRYYDVPKAT